MCTRAPTEVRGVFLVGLNLENTLALRTEPFHNIAQR
jgi:hypothetical protein